MLADIKAAAPAPGLGNLLLAAPPVVRQGERGSQVTSGSRPSSWSRGCMSGQFALPDRLKGPGVGSSSRFVAQPGHAKLTGANIRGILEVWGIRR